MIKYLKLCNVPAAVGIRPQWFRRRIHPNDIWQRDDARSGDVRGAIVKKRLVRRSLSQVNNFTGTRFRKLKRNNAPEGIQ